MAACAAVGLWVVWVQRHPQRLWTMIDLQVLDWGGQMARVQPAALYDGRFDHLLPFLYPPFAALGFAALDTLPFETEKFLEAATVVASVFAVVWLTLGMAARRRGESVPLLTRLAATAILGAAALWLEPVQQTLAFGQVSAALLLMVVADLALDDRHWFKGILIGIATGLKLNPGLFIVYLLLTRRFRATAVAAGALATTAIIGFIALPEQSRQFWSPVGLQSLPGRVGEANLQNQSVNGYLVRILSTPDAAHGPWLMSAVIVGGVGMATAVALFRRYGELGGMLGTALVTLLISPISWTHYWVWLIPALVWGAYEAYTRRSARYAVPLLLAYALFFAYPTRANPATGRWDDRIELLPRGALWTVPWNDGRESQWQPWQQVVGNFYVIVGVAALITVATWVATRGRGGEARRTAGRSRCAGAERIPAP